MYVEFYLEHWVVIDACKIKTKNEMRNFENNILTLTSAVNTKLAD